MEIIEMGSGDLLKLDPGSVNRPLAPREITHIATTLGAFWKYDYKAAGQGRVGKHAILKSGLHSDGFFVSKILLAPENIKRLMANQIAMRLQEVGASCPDYIVGIPDGATELGKEVARILRVQLAQMEKVDGQIRFITSLQDGDRLLLIEDFCTRGTGFIQAVQEVLKKYPKTKILPYDPVILNRGGKTKIIMSDVWTFTVLPIVEWRVRDWDPATGCQLCKMGSAPIKPKATDENWRLITTSQL